MDGKTALVTGGASGIGRAIATGLGADTALRLATAPEAANLPGKIA